MADLALRFKSLRSSQPLPLDVQNDAEFSRMSMLELEHCKLDFGKTHVGKAYGQIWERHPDYVNWFLERYYSTTVHKQRRFLHFCKLKIERAELEGDFQSGEWTKVVEEEDVPSVARMESLENKVAQLESELADLRRMCASWQKAKARSPEHLNRALYDQSSSVSACADSCMRATFTK